MAGDWFRTIALYHLVLELTGASSLALGGVLIAQSLSMFVISPIAGVVADRVDRKAIMIGSDLIRAVLAVGFLFLNSAERLWLAYALTAVMMSVSSFFQPAHMATIPNLTRRDELVTANALTSASWAAMLAVGAGLGGMVTAALGTTAAFCIDAASYVVSAALIAGVRIPSQPTAGPDQSAETTRNGWQDFIRGAQYMWRRPLLRQLLSVKAWSAGVGGSIVLLATLYADQAGAGGMGMVYMVRGIGAVAGPVLARRLVGEQPQALYRTIGVVFFVVAVLYGLFAHMPTFYMGLGVLCLSAMAANILWVFSTTLLQLRVPDAYRGRVFAADFAILTILMAASTLITGWALDHMSLQLKTVSMIVGIILLAPGLMWLSPSSRRLSQSLSPTPSDRECA